MLRTSPQILATFNGSFSLLSCNWPTGKQSPDQWLMNVSISHNLRQQILSFSLKQLFALWWSLIVSADLMGALMELLGNNGFIAPLQHYIYEHPDVCILFFFFAGSCVRECDDGWKGWLHGSHKVTGSGAGSWPHSRQPDSGVDSAWWEYLAGHSRHADRSLGVYLLVTPPISDIILILDRCAVYSTRRSCHRMGISCTSGLLELVHSQCTQ